MLSISTNKKAIATIIGISTPTEVGLIIVGRCFHQFEPHGVTGVLLLAHSHLSVHTWPALNFVAVDVFSCKSKDDAEKAFQLLIEKFGDSALFVSECGFEGVELMGSTGYLISQFSSPLVNQRTDKYGGSAEKRLTFLYEIIERTREKVGHDYPLMVRISGDEFVDGGLTLEDNKYILDLMT